VPLDSVQPVRLGVVYAKDDALSCKQTDLLFGPACLAQVDLLRISGAGVLVDTSSTIERCVNGDWVSVDSDLSCDVLLDLTPVKTVKSEKIAAECAITPLIARPDLDRFELLALMRAQEAFASVCVDVMPLRVFDDVLLAQQQWQWVVIKSIVRHPINSTTWIVTKADDRWLVYRAFEALSFSEDEFKTRVCEQLLTGFFLQAYAPSVTKDQQAIAFNLVLQQRSDGAWRLPLVRSIVATMNPLAALRAGGEFAPTPFLKDETRFFDYPHPNRAGRHVDAKLKRLSMSMAAWLTQHIGRPLGVLGFKFGLTRDLEPILFSIEPTVSSMRGAARYLEMYRHWIEQAVYLAKSVSALPPTVLQPLPVLSSKPLPALGVVWRGGDCDVLLASQPTFVCLTLGHDGRRLLRALADLQARSACFVALFLGHAYSDVQTSDLPSISAYEDYLGKGILRWAESENLRSIRLPLLQAQWRQMLTATSAIRVDLLCLEEADLGWQALPDHESASSLLMTALWFEELCRSGQIGCWGISFFNHKSTAGQQLLRWLETHRERFSHLQVLAFSADRISDQELVDLDKLDVSQLLMTKSQTEAIDRSTRPQVASCLYPFLSEGLCY